MARRVKKRRKTVKISDEILEQIGQLSLMNNAFMNVVLDENLACVEEILRVILGKRDLIVKTAQTQRMLQGFKRSIYLDVYAEDSKGTRYNIEIQQLNDGADLCRARFHMGMIDGELDPVDDGSHTIYINGSAEDDGTEIWKLIHDFRCTKAEEMYLLRLSERVKYLKEDEEGVSIVSNYCEERQAKAVEEAQKREKENLVLKLLEMGKLILYEIAVCTGLTLKRVQMLAKTL